MKTSKIVVMLLTVVVLSLGVAQAAPLISQNFDDTSVFVNGTRLDATGVGSSATSVALWTNSGQTDKVGALVTTAESYSASQSLQVGRGPDPSTGYETGAFLGRVDDGAIAGMVDVTFRAKRGAAGWSTPGVEYEGAGSTLMVGDSALIDGVFVAEAIALRLHSDNNLYVNDNGTYVKILDAIDVAGWATPGTWHAYKMAIDMDNLVYDVWYSADGTDASFVKLYDNAVYSAAFAGSELNAVRTISPYYTTWRGPVWFDDVVMTPEPATMTLIGLGGLALLRRRK